jgi:hypothetical protein
MNRPIADILRIVAAGGGVFLDGTMPTTDLVRVVSQAGSEAHIVIRNTATKSTDDLVQSAERAWGRVVFEP